MSVEFGDARLPDRFWAKIRVSATGCWEWTASSATNGYGLYQLKSWTSRRAHRVAYEHLVGEVPQGHELDHLCRVRRCCNPAHLEPVTRRENVVRGESFAAVNAEKTHCSRGHEFSGDNLRINRHGRICRSCNREMKAERRARKKAT